VRPQHAISRLRRDLTQECTQVTVRFVQFTRFYDRITTKPISNQTAPALDWHRYKVGQGAQWLPVGLGSLEADSDVGLLRVELLQSSRETGTIAPAISCAFATIVVQAHLPKPKTPRYGVLDAQ